MKKIKKIILIFLFLLLPIDYIFASEEIDITKDIEIRYKWYKEVITGEYYPKKDIKDSDLIDKYNIKYGPYSITINKEHCFLSSEFYDKEAYLVNVYTKLKDAKYVLFENFNYKDNIKIYSDNKQVKFKILYNENNILKIELDTNYMCENLLFYIDDASNYKITLYQDDKFNKYLISKEIKDEKIFFPDKTWITNETLMRGHETTTELKESDFTTMLSKYYTCRYREIYVYKYEVKREYYDENYHLNVDGYIKDVDDFKIYYKGKPLTNTIEIIKEKVIKEPKYIYIEKDSKGNDSSKAETTCIPQIKKEIKKEFIEKEIFKIPKIIYLVIILLIITIVILIIKNIKKNVVRK